MSPLSHSSAVLNNAHRPKSNRLKSVSLREIKARDYDL